MFFYKKWSSKLIFLNDFFWKNSVNFGHRRLTLKVQFRPFLTNHYSLRIVKKFPLSMLILEQKACILGPTIFKFHNQSDIKYIIQAFNMSTMGDSSSSVLFFGLRVNNFLAIVFPLISVQTRKVYSTVGSMVCFM